MDTNPRVYTFERCEGGHHSDCFGTWTDPRSILYTRPDEKCDCSCHGREDQFRELVDKLLKMVHCPNHTETAKRLRDELCEMHSEALISG